MYNLKYFPHQFSDIGKLKAALKVADKLISSGKEFESDQVYGLELAKKQIYQFRNNLSLQKNIANEKRKAIDRRGTATAARELRRFFLLLRFIKLQQEGNYKLTGEGRKLISTKEDQEVCEIWQSALNKLKLEDANGISHPYRILKKIVMCNPGIERQKLALAFACNDDSDKEFADIQEMLGWKLSKLKKNFGKYKFTNASLILPSIGVQIGDFIRFQPNYFPSDSLILEHSDFNEDWLINPNLVERKLHQGTKETTSRKIAAIPNFANGNSDKVNLTDSLKLIQKKTRAHQNVVKKIAKIFENAGFKLFEFPFDCLAVKDNLAILVEAKTVDPHFTSFRRQTEKALGQIRGYRNFDLPNEILDKELKLVALLSRKPPKEIIDFLLKNKTNPVWVSENSLFIHLNGSRRNLDSIDFNKLV